MRHAQPYGLTVYALAAVTLATGGGSFNLVPIFTAVIAFMALGEPLAAYHAVGGVLTIGGLLLAELWKQPLRAPRAAATA